MGVFGIAGGRDGEGEHGVCGGKKEDDGKHWNRKGGGPRAGTRASTSKASSRSLGADLQEAKPKLFMLVLAVDG